MSYRHALQVRSRQTAPYPLAPNKEEPQAKNAWGSGVVASNQAYLAEQRGCRGMGRCPACLLLKNRSLHRECNADHGLVLVAAAKRAGGAQKAEKSCERALSRLCRVTSQHRGRPTRVWAPGTTRCRTPAKPEVSSVHRSSDPAFHSDADRRLGHRAKP
jgi:hypothetical protein